MEIPKWLRSQLNDGDFERVENAIRQAEKKTCGEIIPMVVHRSSTVGHVPLTMFLILLSVGLIFNLPTLEEDLLGPHWWLAPLNVIGLLVLTRFLAPLPIVTRMLTPRQDQEAQVEMRSEIEFFTSHFHKTQGRTGILLMISMMEHKAVVLADKAIADKLPPETWNGVIQDMIDGIKTQSLADGLCRGIERCGNLLAEHFPIQEGNVNELPNHLVIKE